jgi:zinc transporter ZupT
LLHNMVIPSFAAGALLATVVFLLIPEAFELLEDGGHDDHDADRVRDLQETETYSIHKEEAKWKFGAACLGGFIIPILMGALFPAPDVSDCEDCNLEEAEAFRQEEVDSGVEDNAVDDEENPVKPSHAKTSDPEAGVKDTEESAVVASTPNKHQGVNWPLVSSIILGDGFHNFTDGIFIGNAFILCSRDIAYTMVATTIYHELAQEIADYTLLTHHCGLTSRQALIANFLSGFSTMVGGLLIIGLQLSDIATGALLSVSAGVYIYIAAAECIPRIQANRKTVKDTLMFALCFVIGAAPIGLVLLNHGHCEESDGD